MQDRLVQITRSLELLEQFVGEVGTSVFEDSLNATTLVAPAVPMVNLDFERIRQFTEPGNRVEITLAEGEWEARVLSTSPSSFDVSVEGPWEDAFPDPRSIQVAKVAAEGDNAETFIQSASGINGNVRLTLLNDPLLSGMHWIRTEDALYSLITRDSWFGFLSLIANSSQQTRLVIQDAGDSSVIAGGLVVHGPNVQPALPTWSLTDEAASYRRTWLRGSREEAPPPTWTLPTSSEGLENLVGLLDGATGLLSWLWLATEAKVESPPIRARFEGMRPVEVDLELGRRTQSLDAVALWEWATATTDPARREAVQQAVSLSIRDERDLPQGFSPVLRTARYLLRISQQGIIAEALATRRTAREAAFTVARDSAESARSALRKTFDRILIQLGAAGGVLLANHQALIDQAATRALLVAILILIAFTALGAFIIDYPSVARALGAFDKDLDHYRDALPDEDLADIRNMASLSDAKSQIQRSRIAAGTLLAVAGIAVVIALCAVGKGSPALPERGTVPTTDKEPLVSPSAMERSPRWQRMVQRGLEPRRAGRHPDKPASIPLVPNPDRVL